MKSCDVDIFPSSDLCRGRRMKDGRRVSDKIQARLSQRDDQFMWSLDKPRPLISRPSFKKGNLQHIRQEEGGPSAKFVLHRNVFFSWAAHLSQRNRFRGVAVHSE